MRPASSHPIDGRGGDYPEGSPLRALNDFYGAFNGRDLDRMTASWLLTAEAVMTNPLGGISRGWEAIRSVYERLFNGPARVHVEFTDYTIHEYPHVFYAIGRERGQFRRGEVVVDLAIRTTRIFVLVDRRWRQVHHHGSIDDPRLLGDYQSAVLGP
jgi:ketosteroid isomerase-like protein